MKTIPARVARRWLQILTDAEMALQAVEQVRPMIEYSVWKPAWDARAYLGVMREQMMEYVVSDVAAEAIPAKQAA